jgi:hypothetical protein
VTRGKFFNGAAELPLGAELYVSSGRAGDLVGRQPAVVLERGVTTTDMSV